MAEMTGHYDEGSLTIPSLVLNVLDTKFEAEGTISTAALPPVNFRWQLSMKDLGSWVPGLAGNVRGEGSLTGSVKDPRTQASLSASDFTVAAFQIDRVELTTDLGLGTSPLSFNANLEGVQLGDTEVGKVKLDLFGTLARHVLGLRNVSDTGTNRLALSGSLSDLPSQGVAAPFEEWGNSTWQFSFDVLDFQKGDIEIDLIRESQSKHNSRIDGESIAIGDTCFNVSDTSEKPGVPVLTQQRICAQANGNYADELNGVVTFSNLPLTLLDPLLPAPVGLSGSLGGRISVGWNVATATPTGSVVLDTSAADLQSTNDQGDIKTLLRFEPGS
ncbi:MAG: autotransporter translocation and assembly factor TamB [Candidatus Azotimanducaceae bacterium]|jgi:autotransporter translocation and assembly factor TamB